MTVDELMLALHHDYLQYMKLPPIDGTPPLSYARFIKVICLLITGNCDDEQGVLERYLIFKQMCRRQHRQVDSATFMAACIMGNYQLDIRIRDRLAELAGLQPYPLVMN